MPQEYLPLPRPNGRRYCLITPCRDEAGFIRTTLETTCTQSILPALWILVDDGSTDDTPQILEEFARQYDFIRVIRRCDRGARAVGPGVIEAFYEGLAHVDLSRFDYIVKFDGDLEIPSRYFERIMELMEADSLLGNLSGKLFQRRRDGTLVEERTGDENAVGPVKFYRVECFEDIGGFVREASWDGIDGHICRMKGWIARSIDDPDLRIVHLRPMGSSQQNIIVGRVRWGRGKYFMGSAWYYALASAIYRSAERPYILGGLAILWGYFKALLSRQSRYENGEYITYLRKFEREQLLHGKRSALAAENERVRRRRLGPSGLLSD